MRLWAGTLLAVASIPAALVLYGWTGAGDCLDCAPSASQRLARIALPASIVAALALAFMCIVVRERGWEKAAAGILFSLLALFGWGLLWILTQN